MLKVSCAGSLTGIVMPNAFDALLKRKLVIVLAAILSVCFSVYCISDFASMARNRHTQGVLDDMNAVMKDVDKLPPGVARWEELVRRLKTLNPGLAPAEVKQALHDYTDALEGSLEAMKAGRDPTQYDARMADAKQRLADCFRKYR
jgi:hypothetical protein